MDLKARGNLFPTQTAKIAALADDSTVPFHLEKENFEKLANVPHNALVARPTAAANVSCHVT